MHLNDALSLWGNVSGAGKFNRPNPPPSEYVIAELLRDLQGAPTADPNRK
jgi:hypothetical protein